MKPILALFCLIVGAFLLNGCQQTPEPLGPTATAERFFAAIGDQDIETARQYLIPEQWPILESMKSDSEEFAEMIRKIEVARVEVDGDSAIAYLRHLDEAEEETIHLRKSEGRWLLFFPDNR